MILWSNFHRFATLNSSILFILNFRFWCDILDKIFIKIVSSEKTCEFIDEIILYDIFKYINIFIFSHECQFIGSVILVNLVIRFYSCLILGGRSSLLNDVAESSLFPRGGKEVTRKAALWYTAKPTNDMRQETMAVWHIASYANLSKPYIVRFQNNSRDSTISAK